MYRILYNNIIYVQKNTTIIGVSTHHEAIAGSSVATKKAAWLELAAKRCWYVVCNQAACLSEIYLLVRMLPLYPLVRLVS